MHSDFYQFAVGFWWLIFPVGWGLAGMFRAWMRHKRAQQALEIIKGYADQGKEVPPDLLNVLQQPDKPGKSALQVSHGLAFAGFLCVTLAVAFCVLMVGRVEGDEPNAFWGMMFVVVLMAGSALAFFLFAWLQAGSGKRPDAP
jgi:hypothetical protein